MLLLRDLSNVRFHCSLPNVLFFCIAGAILLTSLKFCAVVVMLLHRNQKSSVWPQKAALLYPEQKDQNQKLWCLLKQLLVMILLYIYFTLNIYRRMTEVYANSNGNSVTINNSLVTFSAH